MAKPSSKPLWTKTNAVDRVEPSGAKKEDGWNTSEAPPHEFMNWLFYNIGVEWLEYFDTEIDLLIGTTTQYDAVIGVGGTHADINAAVADGGLADNVNVLVRDASVPGSTQVLSKNGWRLTFLPKAIYTKGAATTALSITGERVQIYGARFFGYTVGGDIAISLGAASKNCIIDQNFFGPGTDTEIDDTNGGTNNTLGGNNVTEV